MENYFASIPSSHSPRSLCLSTLQCHNKVLQFIEEPVFKQLLRIKILDLSYANVLILPDSFTELVSLTALLLIGCLSLQHLPMEKLRALKRLDLSETALENTLQGMECLTRLRYLRLNKYSEKEFPSGI